MSSSGSADSLRASLVRIIGRISYWTPSRWRSSVVPSANSGALLLADFDSVSAIPAAVTEPGVTRAELVQALVQQIADLGAAAENRAHRLVPVAVNPVVLPDQLQVVTTDLLAVGNPSSWAEAVRALDETAHLL
jgi:hypothetical protein